MLKNNGFKLEDVDDVVKCEIVDRINRFLVKVVIDGFSTIAYMNNTGRLSEFLVTGKKAYCLKTYGGKTGHRLFAVDVEDGMAAIIDTKIQMRLFEKAVNEGLIYWLGKCRIVKRNCRLGRSLIDYLVELDGRLAYLEVKSAVLRNDRGYAMYPDCLTLRGRKHIMEIIKHTEGGGLGIILFIAALPYVSAFKPNPMGDAEIPKLLLKAYDVGCILKAISMHYDGYSSSFYLDNSDIPVVLQ
ncbi:MAG: DNA/RNA nuclease SfsA [Candidatus Bathyarchaeia archaeon]